jgi:hypothetical protein
MLFEAKAVSDRVSRYSPRAGRVRQGLPMAIIPFGREVEMQL